MEEKPLQKQRLLGKKNQYSKQHSDLKIDFFIPSILIVFFKTGLKNMYTPASPGVPVKNADPKAQKIILNPLLVLIFCIPILESLN